MHEAHTAGAGAENSAGASQFALSATSAGLSRHGAADGRA
jgi:hypothetical protein